MASHFTTPQNMADLIVATGQCAGHLPKVMKISGSKCTLANITLMSPVQQLRDVHFRQNGRLPTSCNMVTTEQIFNITRRGDKVRTRLETHATFITKIHLRSEAIISLLMNNNYNNHNSLVVVCLSSRFRVQTVIIGTLRSGTRRLLERGG